MIRWCTVPEIWCMIDVIVISNFRLFFCPFIPLSSQKLKILKKMKKVPGDNIILHMCNKNYGSWDMLCNGWTDGWMNRKSDILRWAPHLKINSTPTSHLTSTWTLKLYITLATTENSICKIKIYAPCCLTETNKNF